MLGIIFLCILLFIGIIVLIKFITYGFKLTNKPQIKFKQEINEEIKPKEIKVIKITKCEKCGGEIGEDGKCEYCNSKAFIIK